MKKQQFSSKNILGQYNRNAIESRIQKVTKELTEQHNVPSNPRMSRNRSHTHVKSSLPTYNFNPQNSAPLNPFVSVHSVSTSALQQEKQQHNKSQVELKKQVKKLELELKKKMNEWPQWAKFLKTANSSQISHIDIYLQMNEMESLLKEHQEAAQKFENQNSELKTQICNLQQEREQSYENFQREIESSSQAIDRLNRLVQQKNQINMKDKEQIQRDRTLIKEQNKKIALLNEQLQTQRAASNLEICKAKSDFKSQIDHLNRSLEEAVEGGQNLRQQLEKTTKAKQSVQKQLREKIVQFKKEIQSQRDELLGQHQRELSQIKSEFQMELSRVQQQHRRHLNDLQSRFDANVESLNSNNFKDLQSVKTQNSKLVAQLEKQRKTIEQTNQLHKQLQSEKEHLLKQINSKEDKNQKYSSEIKLLKFQFEELQGVLSKSKVQLQQKAEQVQKLTDILSKKQTEILNLSSGISESKKKIQQSQQASKITSKIHCQNYKAIGRLTQINHNIAQLLNIESEFQNQNDEQQLAPIITTLGNLINEFEARHFALLKTVQTNQSKNSENWLQIQSLVIGLVEIVNDSELTLLFRDYLSISRSLRQDEMTLDVNPQLKRRQIFQKIQNRVFLIKSEKYQSAKSVQDSLESTDRHTESIKNIRGHLSRSKSKQQRQFMVKNQLSEDPRYIYDDQVLEIKKRKPEQRVETEPASQFYSGSQHHRSSIRRIVESEADKENNMHNSNFHSHNQNPLRKMEASIKKNRKNQKTDLLNLGSKESIYNKYFNR